MVQNQKHATDSLFRSVIQLFNLKQSLEISNNPQHAHKKTPRAHYFM